MTLAFAGLLVIQFYYFKQVSIAFEQDFKENVSHVLYNVAHDLEEKEVKRFLDATSDDFVKKSVDKQVAEMQSIDVVISPGDTIDLSQTLLAPKLQLNSMHGVGTIATTSEALYEEYKERFYKSRTLLDRVIVLWMRKSAALPVDQRINYAELDEMLVTRFREAGIKYPFRIQVVNASGKIYHSFNSTHDSINFHQQNPKNLDNCAQKLFFEDTEYGDIYLNATFLTGGTFIRKSIDMFLPSLMLITLLTVSLLGYQSNPYPFMKAADLLVCSSGYEGLSTFITEGLVLGKAIVTTECSGMRELLGSSEFGLIVDNQEDALCNGLRKMLKDSELRATYAAHAAERGRDFSARQLAKETEDFFIQLLKD